MKTFRTSFEFDDSEWKAACEALESALIRSPDFRDHVVSLFGSSPEALDEIVGAPLVTSAAVANKVIMRFHPSKGLSKVLAAIPAGVRGGDAVEVGHQTTESPSLR